MSSSLDLDLEEVGRSSSEPVVTVPTRDVVNAARERIHLRVEGVPGLARNQPEKKAVSRSTGDEKRGGKRDGERENRGTPIISARESRRPRAKRKDGGRERILPVSRYPRRPSRDVISRARARVDAALACDASAGGCSLLPIVCAHARVYTQVRAHYELV